MNAWESKAVVMLEDEPDLAYLVTELLSEAQYRVFHVITVDQLLQEASRRSPCVALVDGLSPTEFDLWWVGPRLADLGVPPIAFTAHARAQRELEDDRRGFVGVIMKPFQSEACL